MNVNIKGRTRNIIFISFLAVTILLIIVASSAAADQDRVFLSDYIRYMNAKQMINQDKYTEAEPLLANLVKKHSDTYQILWLYGVCLDGKGKTAAGLEYMKRAREIRPALVMNQSFLIQYGEMLYRSGDYAGAKRYLLESKKYQQDKDYTQKADQLLQELNSKKIADGVS